VAKLKIQIKNLELKTTVTDGFSIYQADFAGCESDVMQLLDKVGISR
jgi:hypothetical protein